MKKIFWGVLFILSMQSWGMCAPIPELFIAVANAPQDEGAVFACEKDAPLQLNLIFYNPSNQEVLLYWPGDKTEIVKERRRVHNIVFNKEQADTSLLRIPPRDTIEAQVTIANEFSLGVHRLNMAFPNRNPKGFAGTREARMLSADAIISNWIRIEIMEPRRVSGQAAAIVNPGSPFSYAADDVPEFAFFPVDESRWDGNEITTLNWTQLNDFQKVMFVTEAIEEIRKTTPITLPAGMSVERLAATFSNFTAALLAEKPDLRISMIQIMPQLISQIARGETP